MSQETNCSLNTTLLAFFAGAAVGAVVVALTTPKKGAELREDLASMGRNAKGKIGDLAQQGSDAWQDVKKGATRAGSELKQGLGDAAKDLRG